MNWKQTAAWQQKYAKKDAIRIASALNKAGIDCEIEYEVEKKGELNARGLQKFLYVDVAVTDSQFRRVGIEMDGKSHSGRAEEDEAKDFYLKMNAGFYQVLHFPNRTPTDKVVSAIMSYRKEFA